MTDILHAESTPAPASLLEMAEPKPLLSDETLRFLQAGGGRFDLARLRCPGPDAEVLLVNRPEWVHHVLVRNHRNYLKGPEFTRIKMLTGAGLIVSDGARWRRSRRLVQPAFTPKHWPLFHRAVDQELSKLSDVWLRAAAKKETRDVSRDVEAFSLSVMLRSLFSDDVERLRGDDPAMPFEVLVEHGGRDLDLVLQVHKLRARTLALVADRRQRAAPPVDLLNVLLSAENDQVKSLADDEVVNEIFTLIVAGYETSAITLSWMWFFSGLYPEIGEKLGKQAGDGEDCPSFAEQVFFETLRLYPPVWMFSRRAQAADRIGDFEIAPGSVVAISPYFLHRRPEVWQDPERFAPERFADMSTRDVRHQSYIPFSAGPRRCIGDVFARHEARVMFTHLASKVRFVPAPGFEFALDPKINLRSRTKIMMTAELV